MGLLSLVGLALVATAVCTLLRQYRPEFAIPVSLAAGVLILVLLLPDIESIMDEFSSFSAAGVISGEYLEVLIKSLGICFVTQIACDTCEDAGERAISSKIELAGRLAVLAASIPLFRQVIAIVRGLISY